MANEEEMEDFEISEQDLQDALQPGQWRHKRLSKDQQIYGVFHQGSDDESSSATYSRSRKRKGVDYTTPVGFVRGGIQQAGGTKKENEETKPKLVDISESDEEDEDEEEHVSFQSTQKFGRGKSLEKFRKNVSADKARSSKQFKGKGMGDMKLSGGMGEWEKHTDGIGAKLLLQMGYEPGKGLGKKLQGRNAPIEVQVRKGRGAIGFYGAEHKNEPNKALNSEDEEEKEFINNLSQWKKGDNSGTAREKAPATKYVYRTSQELIEEATKSGIHKMAREYCEISKVKVIDMTGREQRVLSGYSALTTKRTTEPSEFDEDAQQTKNKLQLEKFVHNVDTLVDVCESEILRNAKEVTSNKDQIAAMDVELTKLEDITKQEEKEACILQCLIMIFEDLEKKKAENGITLDDLVEDFQELKIKYENEYVQYDIANVALSYLIPVMKIYLSQSWRPLENLADEACRSAFSQWRRLLEFQAKKRGKRGLYEVDSNESYMDPYHGLLWHAWMPALRGVIGQWDCKSAEPLVHLVERWSPLLPDWIMENIFDQLILPKIRKEVEAWNPLTDLIPIHAWIHPWLSRLGSRLEVVYPTIRQKMAQALKAWEPSDQSAKSVLLPWVSVFSKGAMEAFLIKNILPKLQDTLAKWTINPNLQHIDVWHWVMQWKDLIPLPSMVSMLEKTFFPKWLQVLLTWLDHSPNYEEIVMWYTGWKTLFPPELSQHPTIKEQFTRALALMNQSLAVGGQAELVAPPPPPPPLLAPTLTPTSAIVNDQYVPEGFREIVEYRCAQQGILFLPTVNRSHAGRPVFRVGKVLSYFDRQVIFVLGPNGVWIPVTIPQLLDMAS